MAKQEIDENVEIGPVKLLYFALSTKILASNDHVDILPLFGNVRQLGFTNNKDSENQVFFRVPPDWIEQLNDDSKRDTFYFVRIKSSEVDNLKRLMETAVYEKD